MFLGAVGGCRHSENFRWDERIEASDSQLTPPDKSEFNWALPSVAVYSYATPTVQSSELSIKDLSDRAQQALVEAVTKKGADADKIKDNLLKVLSLKSAGALPDAVVAGTFKRTLVTTVHKGWQAGPADRLIWTWVDIRPLNFAFEGYTVVATDNQTLNIEQVQNQTSASLQGQIGKTTSNTESLTTATPPTTQVLTDVLGRTLGVSASLSNQYGTSASINQQYVKLSADILPLELRIYRESERNQDVAGNTTISLTLRADPDLKRAGTQRVQKYPTQDNVMRVSKLKVFDDSGRFLRVTDVALDTVLMKMPIHCALLANVTLFYQYRRVLGDASSYLEGDHEVSYEAGSFNKEGVVVVPADAVRPPSFQVYIDGGGEFETVKIIDKAKRVLPVDFSTYEQAEYFASWLNNNFNAIRNGKRLKVGKQGSELVFDLPPKGAFLAQRIRDPSDIDQQCKEMEF